MLAWVLLYVQDPVDQACAAAGVECNRRRVRRECRRYVAQEELAESGGRSVLDDVDDETFHTSQTLLYARCNLLDSGAAYMVRLAFSKETVDQLDGP